MAREAQPSDARAQDRAGRSLRNERRTEVENSWPHVSQDHWCRICRALTNSDAHAAHKTSWHTGQVGKAKRLIMAPDCVSVCTVIGTSSALSPPGVEPVDVSPVLMMPDYLPCLATGWRVYECFLTAVVCTAMEACVHRTHGVRKFLLHSLRLVVCLGRGSAQMILVKAARPAALRDGRSPVCVFWPRTRRRYRAARSIRPSISADCVRAPSHPRRRTGLRFSSRAMRVRSSRPSAAQTGSPSGMRGRNWAYSASA